MSLSVRSLGCHCVEDVDLLQGSSCDDFLIQKLSSAYGSHVSDVEPLATLDLLAHNLPDQYEWA